MAMPTDLHTRSPAHTAHWAGARRVGLGRREREFEGRVTFFATCHSNALRVTVRKAESDPSSASKLLWDLEEVTSLL